MSRIRRKNMIIAMCLLVAMQLVSGLFVYGLHEAQRSMQRINLLSAVYDMEQAGVVDGKKFDAFLTESRQPTHQTVDAFLANSSLGISMIPMALLILTLLNASLLIGFTLVFSRRDKALPKPTFPRPVE